MSERIRVSARNAQKGSDIACEERRQLSRPLCTDWGLRLMGLSSPLHCVTVDTGGDGVTCWRYEISSRRGLSASEGSRAAAGAGY